MALWQSKQNPTIVNSLKLLSHRLGFVIFWRIIYMSINRVTGKARKRTLAHSHEWWGDGTRQTAKATALSSSNPRVATIKRLMAISLYIISDIGYPQAESRCRRTVPRPHVCRDYKRVDTPPGRCGHVIRSRVTNSLAGHSQKWSREIADLVYSLNERIFVFFFYETMKI